MEPVATGLPMRPDDSGEAVRDLQDRLVALSLLGDHEPGRYDAATVAAVTTFQDARGLRADGICGRHTWSALVEAGFRLGDRLLYETKPMLRGDDVADLQHRLGGLGFDAGRVDGIFGPDAAAAVADFQRNCGLTTDGVCGPDTVAALRRLGERSATDPVGRLRELERLRERPRHLSEQRIVVGDDGGLAALVDAVSRRLRTAGATVVALHEPDDSAQAQQANRFDAHAMLHLVTGARSGVAFYGRADYESVGGRRLAELVCEGVGGCLGAPADGPRPMTVPVLRETRMPAVAVELGPPPLVVAHTADLAVALSDAVLAWVDAPTTVST